jgi:hypothetical protein
MNLASIPIADAARLVAKLNSGDADAAAFFSSLFPDAAPCWLCDAAIVGQAVVSVFPDPRNRAQALLAATCPTCMALPDRREREQAMLNAIWPERRWKTPKAAVAEWLAVHGTGGSG